jgi:hypothetical protein
MGCISAPNTGSSNGFRYTTVAFPFIDIAKAQHKTSVKNHLNTPLRIDDAFGIGRKAP